MIESNFRNTYQKYCVDPLLRLKIFRKIHPIALTGAACATGVGVLPLLAQDFPLWALTFLGLTGYLDTLDGSLARLDGKTSDRGAAMDIISDRIVECSIVLGLFLVNATSRALPCLVMLGSILVCVTSFLIVGVFTKNGSEKSFHYSPGIIERAEAFLFFAAMIVFPAAFTPLSYIFSSLVLLTALIRVLQFH